MANKIKYGVKNVYYAVATIGTDGTASYATPVAWPGAVNLSLSAEGETNSYYGDNMAYYIVAGNNGYTGTFESYLIPESFKTAVLGELTAANDLKYEVAEAIDTHFALLFQFEGDDTATRHVMYNCVATRPEVTGATKEDSIVPQTETINITAKSIYVSAVSKDVVKGRAVEGDDCYDTFFGAVVQPTAT